MFLDIGCGLGRIPLVIHVHLLYVQQVHLSRRKTDYSEIPDLAEDETFWSRAEVVVPLTLWLEPDVLAWFKAQGKEYEAHISAALRQYKETHGK